MLGRRELGHGLYVTPVTVFCCCIITCLFTSLPSMLCQYWMCDRQDIRPVNSSLMTGGGMTWRIARLGVLFAAISTDIISSLLLQQNPWWFCMHDDDDHCDATLLLLHFRSRMILVAAYPDGCGNWPWKWVLLTQKCSVCMRMVKVFLCYFCTLCGNPFVPVLPVLSFILLVFSVICLMRAPEL